MKLTRLSWKKCSSSMMRRNAKNGRVSILNLSGGRKANGHLGSHIPMCFMSPHMRDDRLCYIIDQEGMITKDGQDCSALKAEVCQAES